MNMTALTQPLSPPTHVCELRFESSGEAFSCVLALCKTLDPHLAAFLSKPQLTINSNWGNRQDVNVLHVLHVAHGGGPALRVLPPPDGQASSEFKRFHAECMREHQALVIRINEAQELFLGPVESVQADGNIVPVYWGWLLAAGIPSLVCAMLDRSQMGLIFDLDETLLVAHSANTVEGRIESCRKARSQMLETLATSHDLTLQERERLQLSSNSLEKEIDLLACDAGIIRQFAMTNSVRVEGKLYSSRLETAYLEDGSAIQRPVIRLQQGLIILTRIDPLNAKTSMLLRVRPGWNELRAFLAGELDNKQRFDVYVCTAAERQYALEVWRLLDHGGAIIPLEQRQQRIVNVSGGRKKTLLHSLGVLSSRAANKAIALQGEDSTASKQLPLAVVVDDRTEVWEEASQPHILQVLPWMYYRDEAARITRANTQVAAASERELARVRTAVLQLRGEVYQCIDLKVRPATDAIAAKGAPQHLQDTDMSQLLPPLESVPKLLMGKEFTSIYGMPRPNIGYMAVLNEDPPGEFVAAAAIPSSTSLAPAPQPQSVSLKPKDPRSVAQQQAKQATPEAISAVHEQAPYPEDPRRKRSVVPQPPAGIAAAAAQPEGVQAEAPERVQPAAKSSTEQILATLLSLTLGSNRVGGGDEMQAAPAQLAQLAQANPPLFQVMHIILQVMLSNPAIQHAAVAVMEACVKRPTTVPGVVEFLKRNPEKSLMSLYDALQAERLRHEAAAPAAAATAAAPADPAVQAALPAATGPEMPPPPPPTPPPPPPGAPAAQAGASMPAAQPRQGTAEQMDVDGVRGQAQSSEAASEAAAAEGAQGKQQALKRKQGPSAVGAEGSADDGDEGVQEGKRRKQDRAGTSTSPGAAAVEAAAAGSAGPAANITLPQDPRQQRRAASAAASNVPPPPLPLVAEEAKPTGQAQATAAPPAATSANGGVSATHAAPETAAAAAVEQPVTAGSVTGTVSVGGGPGHAEQQGPSENGDPAAARSRKQWDEGPAAALQPPLLTHMPCPPIQPAAAPPPAQAQGAPAAPGPREAAPPAPVTAGPTTQAQGAPVTAGPPAQANSLSALAARQQHVMQGGGAPIPPGGLPDMARMEQELAMLERMIAFMQANGGDPNAPLVPGFSPFPLSLPMGEPLPPGLPGMLPGLPQLPVASIGPPISLPQLPPGSVLQLMSQPLPTTGPGGIPLPQPAGQSLFTAGELPLLPGGIPRPEPPQQPLQQQQPVLQQQAQLPQQQQQGMQAVLPPAPPTPPGALASQQPLQLPQPPQPPQLPQQQPPPGPTQSQPPHQQHQGQQDAPVRFDDVLPQARALLNMLAATHKATVDFKAAQLYAPQPGGGLSHKPVGWNVHVIWNGRKVASGASGTKREAKQVASAHAVQMLQGQCGTTSPAPPPPPPQTSSLPLPPHLTPPPPHQQQPHPQPPQQQQQQQQQSRQAHPQLPHHQQQQEQPAPYIGGILLPPGVAEVPDAAAQPHQQPQRPHQQPQQPHQQPQQLHQQPQQPHQQPQQPPHLPVHSQQPSGDPQTHTNTRLQGPEVITASSALESLARLFPGMRRNVNDKGQQVVNGIKCSCVEMILDCRQSVQHGNKLLKAERLGFSRSHAKQYCALEVLEKLGVPVSLTDPPPVDLNAPLQPQLRVFRSVKKAHDELEQAKMQQKAGQPEPKRRLPPHLQRQREMDLVRALAEDGVVLSGGGSSDENQGPYSRRSHRRQQHIGNVGMGGGPTAEMGEMSPMGKGAMGEDTMGVVVGGPLGGGPLGEMSPMGRGPMIMGGGPMGDRPGPMGDMTGPMGAGPMNQGGPMSQEGVMGGGAMGQGGPMGELPWRQSRGGMGGLEGPPPNEGGPMGTGAGNMQGPAGMGRGMVPGVSMPQQQGLMATQGVGMMGNVPGMMGGPGPMAGPNNPGMMGGPGPMAGGLGPMGVMGGPNAMGMGRGGMSCGPNGPQGMMANPQAMNISGGPMSRPLPTDMHPMSISNPMHINMSNANAVSAHMPPTLNTMLHNSQLSPAQYAEIGRILMSFGLAGPGQPLAYDMRVAASIPGLAHVLKWGGGPEVVAHLARNLRADIGPNPMGGQMPMQPKPPMQMSGPMPEASHMQQQQQQQQRLLPQPPQQQGMPLPGPPSLQPPILLPGPPTTAPPPWHMQQHMEQEGPPGMQGQAPPGRLPAPPGQPQPPLGGMPQPPTQLPSPWAQQQPPTQLPSPWAQQQPRQDEQQPSGAVIIAGAEPEGGFGEPQDQGQGPGRSEQPRSGTGANTVEGGMVFSMKRAGAASNARAARVRPTAREARKPEGQPRDASSTEPPPLAAARSAPKSLIPDLKQQQQMREQARQEAKDKQRKQPEQAGHKEGRGQADPRKTGQQKASQGQRQRQKRELRPVEKKVLDLDALYAAGRSGTGRGVRSSTWADAMDDLGDVLDGDEAGPAPTHTSKKAAPSSGQVPASRGTAATAPAAATAQEGEASKQAEKAESSEEEEGELPSEEGEYVEPS